MIDKTVIIAALTRYKEVVEAIEESDEPGGGRISSVNEVLSIHDKDIGKLVTAYISMLDERSNDLSDNEMRHYGLGLITGIQVGVLLGRLEQQDANV